MPDKPDIIALPIAARVPMAATVSMRAGWILFAAAYALSLALQLPGNVPYDGITVWHEAQTARLYAQHPAALVLIWRLLQFLVPGPGLVTAAQLLPLWLAAKVLVDRLRLPVWLAAGFFSFLLLWPPILAFSGVTVKDVFGGHLALLAFVLALPGPEPTSRPIDWAFAASAATLATLFRYQLGLILPVLAVLWWWQARDAPALAKDTALAAGSAILGTIAVAMLGIALLFTRTGADDVSLSLRKVMVYDIAGTIAADHAAPLPILASSGLDVSAFRAQVLRSYSPLRVDTLWEVNGRAAPDAMHSGVFATLQNISNRELFRQWLFSARNDSGAFVRHHAITFAHVLGFGSIDACRPLRPGISSLPAPAAAAVHADRYHAAISAGLMRSRLFPVGSLFRSWLYVLACLAIAIAGLSRRQIPKEAALLGGFGLAYACSFFVLTQACEVRYSYPVMLAAVFAAAMLASRSRNAPGPVSREFRIPEPGDRPRLR
jgi:hypothetical protein